MACILVSLHVKGKQYMRWLFYMTDFWEPTLKVLIYMYVLRFRIGKNLKNDLFKQEAGDHSFDKKWNGCIRDGFRITIPIWKNFPFGWVADDPKLQPNTAEKIEEGWLILDAGYRGKAQGRMISDAGYGERCRI